MEWHMNQIGFDLEQRKEQPREMLEEVTGMSLL